MMVRRTGIVSAMAWAFLVPIIVGLTVYTESASSPSGCVWHRPRFLTRPRNVGSAGGQFAVDSVDSGEYLMGSTLRSEDSAVPPSRPFGLKSSTVIPLLKHYSGIK